MRGMTSDRRPLDPPRPATLPERPTVDGLEERWVEAWRGSDHYTFDREAALQADRSQIFAAHTPPPLPVSQCLTAAAYCALTSTAF